MSIKNNLDCHNEKVSFLIIGRPSEICTSDDDYIEYINYCWVFLSELQLKLSKLSVLNDDDHMIMEWVVNECRSVHAILERCHKYLSGEWSVGTLNRNKTRVYTAPMSQGKG